MPWPASAASYAASRASIELGDPALRERDFVEYRADSGLHAQIDVACAAAGLDPRGLGHLRCQGFDVSPESD